MFHKAITQWTLKLLEVASVRDRVSSSGITSPASNVCEGPKNPQKGKSEKNPQTQPRATLAV